MIWWRSGLPFPQNRGRLPTTVPEFRDMRPNRLPALVGLALTLVLAGSPWLLRGTAAVELPASLTD